MVVAGLIGTLVRQIPSFALHDYGAYQRELEDLHARYDGASFLGWQFGPAMVDLFERLGFFRVFSSPWFASLATILVISIVACTLGRSWEEPPRTPRGGEARGRSRPSPWPGHCDGAATR